MRKIIILLLIVITIPAAASCSNVYNDPEISVTVSDYYNYTGMEAFTVKGEAVGKLLKALRKLHYSVDNICDCLPRFVLEFSTGDKFYLKYNYWQDDFDGVCKDVKKGTAQADVNEALKLLVDAVLDENLAGTEELTYIR